MKAEDVKRMLVEREDSINPTWNKILSKFGIKNSDLIGGEMFMKVYKEFRMS